MSEPFLAEVKIMGFNFPPRGWAQCDGQILPINQNQSLYSLLGTTFGGDGRTSFALPDLRGRTVMSPGSSDFNVSLGQKGGEETHMLTSNEMPSHTHPIQGTSEAATKTLGDDALFANTGGGRRPLSVYGEATDLQELPGSQLSSSGGQAHENMQPFLALNFCIALQGLFPSRN